MSSSAGDTQAQRSEDRIGDTLLSFLEAHRREYADQVRWFLASRVLVVVIVLMILLIYEEGSPRRFFGAYMLLVLALGVGAFQLWLVRHSDDLERLVIIAVCMDVAFAILVAYFTGGIYNIGFTFLFFASILSTVVLVSDRAGYIVASLATIALALLAVTYWFASKDVIHPPFLAVEFCREIVQEIRPGRVTANLIGMAATLHGVAFMGSRLPRRISQTQVVYDEILERMGEGVVAIDRRGRILLANAEARRLLNWGQIEGLVGSRFEQVLRRDEDRRVLELLARGKDTQVELQLEIRGRPPLAIEVKTTVLRDDVHFDRVRGVVGIFRDLSLRNRVAKAESRLARLLDIEQLALGIAHEIRNPLGSIRGAVQELASHTLTDEADQRLARIVERESDRLDRIIQEFLDFARMRPSVRQRIDLGDLLEDVTTLLAKRPEAVGVTIDYAAGDDFLVLADPDQLRQAFSNIGVNALEALEGSGRLVFTVQRSNLATRVGGEGSRVLRTRPAVEVRIENDGPPIEPDVARKVFAPFFTTKKKGLGLGMAITQKIVRNHEGDVSCEPGSLGGPCFRLVLPSAAPSEAFRRERLNSEFTRDDRPSAGSNALAEEGEDDGDDSDRR